jgi:hypothetical protein
MGFLPESLAKMTGMTIMTPIMIRMMVRLSIWFFLRICRQDRCRIFCRQRSYSFPGICVCILSFFTQCISRLGSAREIAGTKVISSRAISMQI